MTLPKVSQPDCEPDKLRSPSNSQHTVILLAVMKLSAESCPSAQHIPDSRPTNVGCE